MVPSERMKARKEHRVPLPQAAVDLLRSLPVEDGNEFIFIGGKPGAGLSVTTMDILLKRMGKRDATIHGFRSAFRTWAAERTNYPREVPEMALAHTVGDAVENAYRRTTLFDMRRRLMGEWATFCYAPPVAGEVVPLRAGR
jgi:integrase